MGCILSQKEFSCLKDNSEIKDKGQKTWTVVIANCGGPGRQITHLVKDPDGNHDYIFHDGDHMRYLAKEEIMENIACEEFIQ